MRTTDLLPAENVMDMRVDEPRRTAGMGNDLASSEIVSQMFSVLNGGADDSGLFAEVSLLDALA